MTEKYTCPICGYNKLVEPPYDEYECPSYEICACCGFEYGFHDDFEGYTFEKYREEWLNNGAPFRRKKDEPIGWSMDMAKKQLEN